MDLSPGSSGRMVVALAVLGALGLAAWLTMDAGKPRALTLVLLGFFGFRIVIGRLRAGRLR